MAEETKPKGIADLPATSEQELRDWLIKRAGEKHLRWLLALSDDGVTWGIFAGSTLRLSSDKQGRRSPPLRPLTLQQVRLFGEGGELLIWREGDTWHERYLTDALPGAPAAKPIDETYLLWGTALEESGPDGFVLLAEQDGLRHAPPAPEEKFAPPHHRLALQVRHLIAYDADGQARIAASRLCSFTVIPRKLAQRKEK